MNVSPTDWRSFDSSPERPASPASTPFWRSAVVSGFATFFSSSLPRMKSTVELYWSTKALIFVLDRGACRASASPTMTVTSVAVVPLSVSGDAGDQVVDGVRGALDPRRAAVDRHARVEILVRQRIGAEEVGGEVVAVRAVAVGDGDRRVVAGRLAGQDELPREHARVHGRVRGAVDLRGDRGHVVAGGDVDRDALRADADRQLVGRRGGREGAVLLGHLVRAREPVDPDRSTAGGRAAGARDRHLGGIAGLDRLHVAPGRGVRAASRSRLRGSATSIRMSESAVLRASSTSSCCCSRTFGCRSICISCVMIVSVSIPEASPPS